MWSSGLFIWMDYLFDAVVRCCKAIGTFANRNVQPKLHWRDMDYKYLEALNELNVMCPTDTEEERGLARYLEFNNEEDHVRRQHKNQESPKSGGTVRGSYATLLSPGLSQLSGGGYPSAFGGLLGGLGAGSNLSDLANAARESGQLQQQLMSESQQTLMAMQMQQSQMVPGSAMNNINPLAALLAAQAKRTGVN